MKTYEGYRRFKGAWRPSQAERRVLEELAAGRTNAEIAVKLGISPETVKSHVARLLGETGCSDRAALGRWWEARRESRRSWVPMLRWGAALAACAAAVVLAGWVVIAAGPGVAHVVRSLRPHGAPAALDLLESTSTPVSPPAPAQAATPATVTPIAGKLVDFIWEQRGTPPATSYPLDFALDDDGNIYTAERRSHEIQVFSPDGRFLRAWGREGNGDGDFRFLAATTGATMCGAVVVDGEGRVLVADQTGRVQIFSREGGYLGKWPTAKGRDPGQLDTPCGMAASSKGVIYIANQPALDPANVYAPPVAFAHIDAFDLDGRFLARWSSFGSGPGQLASPAGLAISQAGVIHVADNANHRVQMFDERGVFLGEFGRPGDGDGEFSRPRGIAIDRQGNIYVSDTMNHRVQMFDATGRYLTQGGGAGKGPGEFNRPAGIAVDSQGFLYVGDVLGGRVQKIRLR